ncbi:hypothetical protein GCM10023219_03540 [Stakelama sediminis]|uniref:Uncharacterized protein n=1 Tax=Stakelama sediminis TaxID=463200 RepID=A0A840YZT9_9SPHN|nr:hypothetical protein [Stakelama sediminis]MBB5719016.1 hypothetical protein [Stakelama sediminis]
MSEDPVREYYLQRAETERQRAETARSHRAAARHYEMAEYYLDRARNQPWQTNIVLRG